MLPLVAPHPSAPHCTAWSVQAVQAAPCGPPKDPQVVPGRPHCKSYKGLSSFHLFFGTGQPWMVVWMLLRLAAHTQAAWSNQPTRMAMRRRHRRPLCARPALVPHATACCATAAASTVAGGSYREEAQAMRSHRSKCCRHRRRRLYRQLPRLPPRRLAASPPRRRWLLHASVLLCLKQESSQLLLLLLWLLLCTTMVLLCCVLSPVSMMMYRGFFYVGTSFLFKEYEVA